MDANSAAARIQLAWRYWRIRARGGGGISAVSDQEEDAAQATSGYMSASSTRSSSSSNSRSNSGDGGPSTKPAGTIWPPPAALPRRSWTALPLNLHRFGDSSAESTPSEFGAFAPSLSVGESPGLWRPCKESATMQLCYRNDAASETEEFGESAASDIEDYEHFRGGGDGGSGPGEDLEWRRFCRPAMHKDSLGSRSQQISGKSASRSLTRRPLEPELLESLGIDCDHEILSVHSRLRGEAQLALAQAKPMAQMQLKVDTEGGTECSWTGRLRLNELHLVGPATLRMLRASLSNRIEICNGELVSCLVERDDLHMEQDSLLVEIEDLTRRAQDAAKRLRNRGEPVTPVF